MTPERIGDDTQPKSSLLVELDGALGSVVEADHPQQVTLRDKLERKLAEVLDRLGIPGRFIVAVRPLAPSLPRGRFLRLSVDGRPCRYSDEILSAAQSFVAGVPTERGTAPADVASWLVDMVNATGEVSGAPQLVEYLTITCVEIVKRDPAVLLGPPQVSAYVAILPAPDGEVSAAGERVPVDVDELGPILREILRLGISIVDRGAVARTLTTMRGRPTLDITEALVAALRPDAIEIRLEPSLLKQITIDRATDGPALFANLRKELFQQSGVLLPPLHFVPDESLKPNCFALTLNHLTTLPWVGRNGDQLEYLVLCLAASLRESNARLVDQRATQNQLDALRTPFPALVQGVASRLSIGRVTYLLRSLAAEEVSIRNLRAILECLIDYPSAETAESGDATDLVTFVRVGMARQLRNQYAMGEIKDLLWAFVSDASVDLVLRHYCESLRVGSNDAADKDRQAVVEAIYASIANGHGTVSSYVILTSAELRPALQEVVAPELPRVHVLAYEEIPLDVTIQTIGQISTSSGQS